MPLPPLTDLLRRLDTAGKRILIDGQHHVTVLMAAGGDAALVRAIFWRE